MKISELIEELENHKEMMGDLEVKGMYKLASSGLIFPIDEVTVNWRDTPDGREEFILLIPKEE